ncbi:MAG: DUF4252 domain-containing protein [Bacteroidota bacterium]
MKKLAIVVAFLMAPMMLLAQGPFDSYEGQQEVTTVVVTKHMFKILSNAEVQHSDPEVQEYMEMIDGLESVKIFATENPNVAANMKSDVERYLASSGGLEELMRIKKDDANVKLYSRWGSDESTITELLFFVEGAMDDKSGAVIATVTGEIDLKHISRLTKDLSMPTSDFIVSPNPATDYVTIKAKEDPITSIVIYDSTGKKVFSEENINERNKQVSISGLSKGVYLVSVNNQVSQKLLKN